MGRDACTDDVNTWNQHHCSITNPQEVLSMSGVAMTKMPAQTVVPKIEVRERREPLAFEEKEPGKAKVAVRNLDFFYGQSQALHNISLEIPEQIVMAFIGPSGCGKSTFLRTLNRMNDVIPATRVEGEVLIDDHNIYSTGTDVVELRRKVGMVFQ